MEDVEVLERQLMIEDACPSCGAYGACDCTEEEQEAGPQGCTCPVGAEECTC